jgi:hypothetical protein
MMKPKKLRLFTTFLLLLPLCVVLLGTGCRQDDVSQSVLNGKWTLLGLGNDSTGEYTLEPDSEPKSSYVIFDNGLMIAYSVSNVVENVKYVLYEEHKIVFSTYGMETLIGGDTEWGQQFLNLIIKIYEFEIKEDELKLYYEDQSYMKLKKEIK